MSAVSSAATLSKTGRKLRVLCLHGFMTNSKIMQYQTRKWIKYFEDILEFEFLDGQYKRNVDEIDDASLKRILQKGDSVYSWVQWNQNDMLGSLKRDIRFVVDHIEKEGPFDGLIGFSQGGGVINSILQCLQANQLSINHMPSFFVIINAPFFHLPLSKAQIDVPTLHFYSPQDEIIIDRPLLMTTFYKNPLIISHSHGHKVPRLEPQQIVDIKKFILSAIKRSPSSNLGTTNNEQSSIQPRL